MIGSNNELGCPFRLDVHTRDENETATCGFLQRLTGADDEFCVVDRSACELCIEHSPFASAQLNPVIPSLLVGVCEAAQLEPAEETPTGALRSWAESVIKRQHDDAVEIAPASYACDVILVCGPDDHDIAPAVESVLDQDGVFTIVHLIDRRGVDAPRSSEWDRMATRAGVRVHQAPASHSLWDCVQWIIPRLETPFFALQRSDAICPPHRLETAITKLDTTSAELYLGRDEVANWQSHNGTLTEWPSLVLRRGTFVDMGGFDLSQPDVGREFLDRAVREGRRIEMPNAVKCDALTEAGLRNAPPTLDPQRFSPGSASGFPIQRAACDVVLPFRDDLLFVRESLEGLLAQTDAEVVIHLVDDDSRESVDAFFDECRQYSNVRLYKNRCNLGPFATFNNIAAFAETPFIAVQDADDISLPTRIARSCHLLETADADILGGRTELFGDEELILNITHDSWTDETGRRQDYRFSRYPNRQGYAYFIENPTLVMRVDAFRRLGGYADFGEAHRSRTGVDTDFLLRAYLAGAAFVVTNDSVIRYRCHGNSATNHAESGMGSEAHTESHDETQRRFQHYAGGTFNPRCFGALGQHAGVTVRVSDP